jgi:hypothetical protein
MANPTSFAIPRSTGHSKSRPWAAPVQASARRLHAGICAAALFLLPFALVVGDPASAQASPCGDQIAALASAERDLAIELHAPQSVDAQLHHQPTPGTVAVAQSEAKRAHVQKVLTAARRLDAQGKNAECMATLRNGGLLN